jgi:hypothetical protein
MHDFWLAEAGTGEGRAGGGLSFLTAKAFQRDKEDYPDYE